MATEVCDYCQEAPKRTDRMGRATRFCSKRCQANWHNKARRQAGDLTVRDGHNNYAHKQRTLRFGNESPGVTHTQWRAILAFYGDRCAYCGAGDRIERDHIVPVTRGGLHEPTNVVPACRRCNRDKRDRLLGEWRPDLTFDRFDPTSK
jgi:5-methylcytosine-specific restriction endonuclease McrA